MVRNQVPPMAGYPGMLIDDTPGNINKGFAFFNETVRPRRIWEADHDDPDQGRWRRVEFGQSGGEYFHVFHTSPKDLRDFGLGVAM